MDRPGGVPAPDVLPFGGRPAPEQPCVLALGVFDGVHIGHAALLELTCRQAAERKAVPAVFTFDTPAYKDALPLLSLPQKIERLARPGIRRIYLARFDDVRDLPPDVFVSRLSDACRPAAVVVGYDFRFGAGAVGTAATLRDLLAPRGVETLVVPPVCLDGAAVSSSQVREALLRGDPARAAKLLGRPFCLSGGTVRGKMLGRRLGCPTLNLPLDPACLIPRYGVYRCLCETPAGRFPAVCNVGVRPTVEAHAAPNCEVHLLTDDPPPSDASLPLSVFLLDYLRQETAFDTPDRLAAQLARDVEEAKRAFALDDRK